MVRNKIQQSSHYLYEEQNVRVDFEASGTVQPTTREHSDHSGGELVRTDDDSIEHFTVGDFHGVSEVEV